MTHTTDPTVILGIVAVIASFSLLHLARRYRLTRSKLIPSQDISFMAFQRAMHWTIGGCSAALFVSGLPIYLSQFMVNPPVQTPLLFYYWGFQVLVWRTFHIYLALVVVLLVVVHALWDVYRLKAFGRMKVSKIEAVEAWSRVRNFLGLSKPYRQPTARYDMFQKAFHWTLLGLGAFLLISGLLMWPALTWQGVPLFIWLDRFNHTLMDGFMRTGHLVASMVFAGLLVLHVYFALLPQNRPFLRSMIFGVHSGRRSEGD